MGQRPYLQPLQRQWQLVESWVRAAHLFIYSLEKHVYCLGFIITTL